MTSLGPRSLRVTFKSRLTSPGSCSGDEVLAFVRPVAPNTLSLSTALSASGVSGSDALERSPGRPVASPASFRRMVHRPSGSSALLLKLEVILQKPLNYEE